MKKDYKSILVILGIIIIAGLIFNPFRYKITGTSKGYMYKTDRYTGKSWIVSPKGEIEIGTYEAPTSTPVPVDFPIAYLTLSGFAINEYDLASVTVKNTADYPATDIVYKFIHYDKKGGSVVDTQYLKGTKSVNAGDTINESIFLGQNGGFVTVEISSAKALR